MDIKVWAQIVGAVGILFCFLIFQQKNRRTLIFLKLCSDFIWAAHYFLLGAYSGVAVALVGVARETVFYNRNRKWANHIFWMYFFGAVGVAASVLVGKDIFCIFPAAASFMSAVCFWQNKPKFSRRMAFPVSVCMLTYDCIFGSYMGIVNEIFAITSIIIGYFHYDRKRKIGMKQGNLIPMFSLTGKPDEKELENIFSEYSRVGINVLLLYPRSGLEYEYLSDDFFEMVKKYVNVGKKYGFRFWLYDEYNWPSCGAGGLVTAREEFRLKALIRVKRDGKDYAEIKTADGEGNYYPDVLNPRAVEEFIRLTHERYKQKLGKYFGKEIIGFFTDEPSYVYIANRNAADWILWKYRDATPYYEGMAQDYKRLTGRELLSDFINDGESGNYCSSAGKLLCDRFEKTFFAKIKAWCESNGLEFSGHLYSEHDTATAIKDNYDIFKLLQGFTKPGIDNIYTALSVKDCEWDALSAVECVLREKKITGLAELFALGPTQMNFSAMKRTIWLSAAFGISEYVLAVAAFDARGNYEKDSYYTDFSSTDFRFESLKLLAEEAEKAAMLAGETPVADVCVLYPLYTFAEAAGKEEIYAMNNEYLSFLSGLSQGGFLWKVKKVSDNECDYCFGLDKNGFIEYKSGRKFPSADAALCWLSDVYSRRFNITLKNGGAVKDVFTKFYQNGTLLLLNLSETPKRLCVHCGGNISDITLYGVKTLKIDESVENNLCTDYKEVYSEFGIEYLNNAYFRPFFDNGKSIISAEKEVAAEFYIRTYPTVANVCFNGEEISANVPAENLPRGFSSLYKKCKITLKNGENHISAADIDKKYLPICLLSGDFISEGNIVRQGRKDKIRSGEELPLCGKIQLSVTADLTNAEYIGFDCQGYYAKLFVCGESAGERAEAPYSWEVPLEYRKKEAKIQIEIVSSLSGIFGETDKVGSKMGKYACQPDYFIVPELKIW